MYFFVPNVLSFGKCFSWGDQDMGARRRGRTEKACCIFAYLDTLNNSQYSHTQLH